jgi:processive 1,2-diacylglycerol beta-glucosyltransferase
MSSPRVLVVSGSAGHGHVKAAEAVTRALQQRHPMIDVVHVDAVSQMARWYARTYRWGYVTLVDRFPALWRALYEATDRKASALGHGLTVLGGRRFVDSVLRWKPRLVLCTHFLPPELLSRAIREKRLQTEVHVVVTDHDAHRMWYWPEVDRWYVASELVKARFALRYGIPESRLAVTGIPVRPEFGARHDRVSIRARYGLDPDRPVVLFLTGGFSAGPMSRSILGIWMDRRDAQMIAVCGKNDRLRRRVAALPRPAGAVLHALPFVENVAELMSVADVVICKSGGITVSECSAAGKPLLVSGHIPGQEERNADAVVEAGAGVRALTPEEVRWRVNRFLEDPSSLALVARRAKAFGRPQAAADIADRVAGAVHGDLVPTGPRFHGAP